MNAALKLGADYVATGHYARRGETEVEGNKVYQLLSGKDLNKDQSYFLCQLTQAQLSKALFPVGELMKPEVRAIAKKANLVTAEKKDSQGLCFIGKVHLPDFLQQQLQTKKGNVIAVDLASPIFKNGQNSEELEAIVAPYHYSPQSGKVVGEHGGAHFYTIGQRKGLHMGGFAEPMFVIGTDTKENIIYMGMGEKHPGLHRKGLFVPKKDEHWVRQDRLLKEGESKKFMARIRYRQPLEACTIHKKSNGLYIIFDHHQKSITPGQFCAWYAGEELIGSGVIS